MVYHQTLIRSKDGASTPITDGNGGGLSVIRKNDWQVNLYCYYNASGQVHSRFHTKAEATQNVSGTNEFKFRLVMYKDNKFEQPYTQLVFLIISWLLRNLNRNDIRIKKTTCLHTAFVLFKHCMCSVSMLCVKV